MLGLRGLTQAVLDQREAIDDVGGQRGVWQFHGYYGAQSGSLEGGAPALPVNRPSAGRVQGHPTICARQRNPRYARSAMGEHLIAQRTKSCVAAWLARLRSGSGTMPSTSVTITPTPTATAVNMLGVTTAGPSGAGSLKNMSTITRT